MLLSNIGCWNTVSQRSRSSVLLSSGKSRAICCICRFGCCRLPVELLLRRGRYEQYCQQHIFATFSAVVGGFALAIITGIPLAVMIVYSAFLRRVIYPLLLMVQSVPKVALAPLLLLWVGYGLKSNIIVAATVAFFPIVINTATGLESVDTELIELTRSLDAGTLRVFWRVRLPWALPYIFSSLKVAITLAVIGAIVAEFIGADKGLGYLILTSSGEMKTSLMFGVLLILSLLGILCFYAVCLAERILCPWYLPVASNQVETLPI